MAAQAITFEPKYITFDCYGTLTNFSEMGGSARRIFADRIPDAAQMDAFVRLFSIYRYDEVLGPYKPYDEVLANAVRRTCARFGIACTDEEADSFYQAVPTWGPWPDVPDGLRRLATKYPLVILSNTNDAIIQSNVDKLGAPFHRVFTAQQAQSYKPRMPGFEYMLAQLGCQPADVLHVSACIEYDVMTAEAVGIQHRVFVNRKKEPTYTATTFYEVSGIDELATRMGL